MEFIPLDKGKRKNSKRPREETQEEDSGVKKSKRLGGQNDGGKDSKVIKFKQKAQAKTVQKKNVRNKYRENLAAKKKTKTSKKKTLKKIEKEKQEDEDKEEEENDVEDDESDVENEENVDNEEDDVEDEEENEENSENEDDDDDDGDDEDKNSEEEAFKKKCKELDEKKKNRLFVKFPKKIHSEAQVKELHPDIRQVIFPRKKRTRWCWAVFASEEKADAAMKTLLKTKDKKIFVNKPTPHDKVTLKLKEKMKTVLRKKEAKRKLQQMWT